MNIETPLAGPRLDLGTPLTDSPAGATAVRPFALRELVDIPNAPATIAGTYCPIRQFNVGEDGESLPPIVGGTLTNPDGNVKNPPPWDKD